ncbi:unnamed protein product [Penicillium nalgiovense]|uniref:Uncharacterized protein n=1 Tax=Penicillium nalgiovense TaxID=60175 RepID=A0A1V6XZK0_PENNA|nr:hypothetical protein PENNAL_c0045G10790 [Penicillium nalgiovense]CAG7935823.1 unnamed protein product [Penicillium nalgiovense]CAG7961963.1 unnamed protein product [Penicillium nalgiovense]CAG7968429.1 unnamed protein product [Penicillium nalgiovense]CAG7972344.1 unnamed protein product [Penicillium nalgiovense]
MAIFDSEKRPRGLRVPSLTALKSSATKSQFSLKKSSDSVPSESTSPKPAAFPAPPPPKPAPPPDKELPLPPPSDNPYFPPIPRNEVLERRPIQRVPVPTQSSPWTTGMRTKKSQPDFHAPQQPTPVTSSSPPQVPIIVPTIVQDPAPVPAAVPAPADEANSPQLEEFIPTPESAEPPAVPEQPREELAPSPFVPPDVEPVAPKLNEIHLTCYQQHRAMPVAQNTWCPMPCMTCQKFDMEIRHRCVFCCLRICESCYQTLQKCKNRSVEELVDRIVA